MTDRGSTELDYLHLDTSPLHCTLREALPLRIELISGQPNEGLWNDLVRQHHYLGFRQMVGRSLKYIVYSADRPVAAVGWRAAAVKVRVRDCYIGWSPAQRRQEVDRIANNSRFLILPWVRVPHLGSHLLSRLRDMVVQDWQRVHGRKLFMLKSFVDGSRFAGTIYKADNWIHLGQSKGYTKKGKGFVWHGHPKEVWVYVVEKNFRRQLGVEQRSPSQWSPRLQQREGELAMMMRRMTWNPALLPPMQIGVRDMEQIAEEVEKFHAHFCGYYIRREQHRHGLAYLSGLLSNLQRKNTECIALLLLGPVSVRRLQDFITNYRWDHEGMLGAYQRELARLIGEGDAAGMLNVDSSENVKKGRESVGVARQYCGAIGKVENCQSGVFVGYAGAGGYGLIDCQLYLPQQWFSDEYAHRRQKCQIPASVSFQTKVQIARQLIGKVKAQGVFHPRWVGCDCTFGSSGEFLDDVGMELFLL